MPALLEVETLYGHVSSVSSLSSTNCNRFQRQSSKSTFSITGSSTKMGFILDVFCIHFRCNVDLLRIIQLGLTFMDENGKTPPGCTTWQFNFKFNLQ